MPDIESTFNSNVYAACVRLLYEVDIMSNISIPYAIPYANYVLSWCKCVPIKTIVIGQNPYPQNIYSEIGSALSYDITKAKTDTMSVRNIAYDINNYDGTDIKESIDCFRNSWALVDRGIVFINETVFDALSPARSNVRGIKEMESQVRALQVLIIESYLSGQGSFTCIGMGTKAEQMTSILRSWCPKDLFKIRAMSCRNPAARDIGDRLSHEITMGKTQVSKALSEIVKEFVTMAGPRMSPADRRRDQNKEALRKATENIDATSDVYISELESFERRLRSIRDEDGGSASIDELEKSLGSLRRSVDSHRNAVSTHTISMIMAIESMSSDRARQESAQLQHPAVVSLAQSVTDSMKPRGPRRRISRLSSEVETVMQSVEETPEPPDVVHSPAPSVTPSRRRRVSRRAASHAPSDAGTEYTTEMGTTSPQKEAMSVAESVNVRCFANWCNDNVSDTTYYEILNTAADEKAVINSLVKDVLDYIRLRKSNDPEYDPYDELIDASSESSKWATNSIVHSK